MPTDLQKDDEKTEEFKVIEMPVEVNKEVRKSVLIVDDDDEISELVSIVLKKEYDVHVAKNGEIGVEKAKELSPDLILMDLSMPILDGYGAAKLIKNNPKTTKIPIIALSARAMSSEIDRALEAGCNDHMSKPFKIQELKTMVKKYV